jgi:ABC-type multidrug transport system ATPase subunit
LLTAEPVAVCVTLQVLCDRLGIFVDGRLVCIGTPSDITARFGGFLVSCVLFRGFFVKSTNQTKKVSPGGCHGFVEMS